MTNENTTQSPPHRRARSARHPRSAFRGAYPFERQYEALQSDENHPIDAQIDRIREIGSVDRKARELSRHFENHVDDPAGFRDYEDLRLLQRCLRERAFFDAGFAEGRLVGRGEALEASVSATTAGRELTRTVLLALRSGSLSNAGKVGALLEIARAVTLEIRPLGSHRGETSRRRQSTPRTR